MLFSMQLLIEMSSGAFRTLEARVDALLNGSLNKTKLSSFQNSGDQKSMLFSMPLLIEFGSPAFRALEAEIGDFLVRSLNRTQLSSRYRSGSEFHGIQCKS